MQFRSCLFTAWKKFLSTVFSILLIFPVLLVEEGSQLSKSFLWNLLCCGWKSSSSMWGGGWQYRSFPCVRSNTVCKAIWFPCPFSCFEEKLTFWRTTVAINMPHFVHLNLTHIDIILQDVASRSGLIRLSVRCHKASHVWKQQKNPILNKTIVNTRFKIKPYSLPFGFCWRNIFPVHWFVKYLSRMVGQMAIG